MAENPKLETSDMCSEACELDEIGTQKISVSDQTNSLQFTNIKSDSFVMDMERLSHLTDKDRTANSRITRSLSRKGSQQRRNEKKINPSTSNERETNFVASASPRAALGGASTPEKPIVVTVGATDHPMNPQLHHQITIMTGNIAAATTTAESRCTARRFSFRRPPASWSIDPRRILFFFATLSSMGTILLIYFTLSMGKLSGDESNW